MKVFVGLGNPGDQYARNRHNIGFMALEALASRHHAGNWQRKWQGRISEATLGTERILLLMPQTYMNESGRSVAEAVRFHRIPPQDVVVFHDELDLAPGKVRVKLGGGVAGHNGLRSIRDCLGTPDYKRVRLGIGHPGHKDKVLGHVLGDFSKNDRLWLDPLLDALADAAPLLSAGDDAGFMNRVALLTASPKAEKPPAATTRQEPASSEPPGQSVPKKLLSSWLKRSGFS
ncbi:MAG TPA: aminoacyl-tRNA hydrolase [Geminicoccus sp.]|jgi:PTH1 family peptidyl-tRNA hydrolase|uniref:aminoacyl-tRNA hydrolase n=1 Tax=Geminicoccus sp. TaxID=2024832 RepID=UPI002E31957C|nr:aminoacyl-tRNA hydrolase [Geminicoccus sp.]HEX2525369.1 aminoacyl-tRNA hydrolase [Geminicoccus sp.]